ncbi:hypothetical protein LCGC14_2990500, partial [marine sediment metagenome]
VPDSSTKVVLPGYRVRKRGHGRQISLAAKAINNSQKPVIYAGGGIISSNASSELRELAEKANLPVTMTLLGLGCYDQRRAERPTSNVKWQWDYRSDEFAANYLGHILHYVEGMIIDVRDKRIGKETKDEG